MIGSALVANAPPDGYTFLISSIGTHVIAPATSANPGYDPIASFTHVAFVGGPPTVIAVNPALGVRSLQELLALLKRRSEPLPYVSPGPGTIGNLIAEFWAERESVKLSHVAYKGSGQAITDLVAGHVQMGSMTWTAALGQMQAKTIIPLAVSSTRRMPSFPDVPTLKELGYPDLAVTTWFGFAAPAGLPADITLRMNEEIDTRSTPRGEEPFRVGRLRTRANDAAEFAAFIRRDIARWAPLAKLMQTDAKSVRYFTLTRSMNLPNAASCVLIRSIAALSVSLPSVNLVGARLTITSGLPKSCTSIACNTMRR